jgi:hypothetical protein
LLDWKLDLVGIFVSPTQIVKRWGLRPIVKVNLILGAFNNFETDVPENIKVALLFRD